MAKAEYADMIKTVSGALTKINKKSPHAADQKMVLATHRVAATTNPNCSRLYLRGLSAVTRSTPVTADEQAHMAQTATDIAAFNAQKDQPGGLKTLKAYRWNICAQAYDQNNG